MPFLLVLMILLCPFATSASVELQQRLADVADAAEQISSDLLAKPADSLTTEDWLVLADAHLRLRHKEAAIDSIDRALNLAADPYLQAQAYVIKAQIYGILYRDTPIAITQLERAEQLLLNEENPLSKSLYGDVLQNFAQAYNQLGNIKKALPYAERSVALALELQQPDYELRARITLGRIALQDNAYSLAYSQLNQALQLATALHDEDALASIHFRLGMAYRKIEDHPQALAHLQEARQRYHALQRHGSYTYTLIYIGETYLEDPATANEAATYLNEALTLARQQDDLLRVGIATQGLGRLALLQNDIALAKQHYVTALQLFRQQSIQTYAQECSLALAELFYQQQQYNEAAELLQGFNTSLADAAAYLQFRYRELSAKLAAQRGDWQSAYTDLLIANTQRFEQFTEQNKLRLDIIQSGLAQTAADNQQQQSSKQLLTENTELRQRMLLLQLGLITLAIVTLLAMLLWKRSRTKTTVVAINESLQQQDWNRFCQSIQQHEKNDHVQLLALSFAQSQQLKLQYGQHAVQHALQAFVAYQDDAIFARCIESDTIWLALSCTEKKLPSLQLALSEVLQQLLPIADNSAQIVSVHFPVNKLLAKPWLDIEISSLKEAFWLSWALAEASPEHAIDGVWQLSLQSDNVGACEWRSSAVRQDLLNAIRLSSIRVLCNGDIIPASTADAFS